ncbi:Pyridoxine 5'-phosphate synthase [Frankliniella fusca]|uniref:Pyridoxine 5'-phosphate synthase n=1 Tax=Frankliniella fusca TaxID=407009 RepID=A0AAE1HW61_9NEOP|nr:Pyridoxine 5'-phosphate synthase [Frankliniella fusca]
MMTSLSAPALVVSLALALAGGVSAKDPLLGVKLASGASATVLVGTELIQGLDSRKSMTVALCGRSSCCRVQISGYYNGHPGQVDTLLQDYNNLNSIGSYSWVQRETDSLKLASWLPENDTMVLAVSNNHQVLTVAMADGLFGRSSRSVTLQCRPDETQLLVESSNVGSNRIQDKDKVAMRGPVLSSSEQVTLTMALGSRCNGYSGYSLVVGLCTDNECATVVITTPNSASSGNLAFGSGITRSNNPNDDSYVTYQETPGSGTWSVASYDFSVAFHPDGLLQVWLKPDTVAQVPLPAGWDTGAGLELKALHGCGSFSYSKEVSGTKSRRNLPKPIFPTPIRVSSQL